MDDRNVVCQRCGAVNPAGSNFCQKCAYPLTRANSDGFSPEQPAPKKKRGCLIAALIVIGVVVVLFIIGLLASQGKEPAAGSQSPAPSALASASAPISPSASAQAASPTATASSSPSATAQAGKETITLAEFNNLNTGISYEEAVKIIGGEGKVLSQVDVAGYKTVIYQWNGEGSFGANANATFQNNKLIAKAQIGLQ